MTHATDDRATTVFAPVIEPRPPGYTRLRIGAALLLLDSVVVLLGIVMAVLGWGTMFIGMIALEGVPRDAHFVAYGVVIPLLYLILVALPLAVLGWIGGNRLWAGGAPRLALVTAGLWAILALALAAMGGWTGIGFLWQVATFALIASGVWAGRQRLKGAAEPSGPVNDSLESGAV